VERAFRTPDMPPAAAHDTASSGHTATPPYPPDAYPPDAYPPSPRIAHPSDAHLTRHVPPPSRTSSSVYLTRRADQPSYPAEDERLRPHAHIATASPHTSTACSPRDRPRAHPSSPPRLTQLPAPRRCHTPHVDRRMTYRHTPRPCAHASAGHAHTPPPHRAPRSYPCTRRGHIPHTDRCTP
jgi:hypothetical protein